MSTTLKRDICGLHTPGALTSDVERGRVEQCLPLEVQYACLYWVQHLQRSGTQLYDNNQVRQFLWEHFLHWLEALSLMRKTSEGILAITSLETIVEVSDLNSKFRRILANTLRLIKAPISTRLSMMRSDSPYITN
jgi:hypothetical protein